MQWTAKRAVRPLQRPIGLRVDRWKREPTGGGWVRDCRETALCGALASPNPLSRVVTGERRRETRTG